MSVQARGLTSEEIDRFLSGPVTARLGTVKPDGAPYVVPVWQQWDGESMWIIPRERSSFVEHIRHEPRVCLSCADDGPGHRRVLIEGVAEIVEGPARMSGRMLEIARDMAVRYMGPEGPRYLSATAERPRYLVRVRVTGMRSWQGGEWHPRYV
ncbi:MAG: pyridoxamine 5'-phosphate oxidase family protein [Gemmatimonadetes bacterium]|nr:pyridoxamine 5'-phosphate oxidase family protein [Gemmatimonadota bacterium]